MLTMFSQNCARLGKILFCESSSLILLFWNTIYSSGFLSRAIRIAPFANRLSFDKIPPKIQQLRCFANFEALRFAQPIAIVGKRLVELMKAQSANNDGKYVAVHLRFEEVSANIFTF